jgi:hypothetical protein
MPITIPTDVGNLVLDEIKARRLVREIQRQLTVEGAPAALPTITDEMLRAGVTATRLNIGYPKRFLDSELEGIVKRVYIAMRVLE